MFSVCVCVRKKGCVVHSLLSLHRECEGPRAKVAYLRCAGTPTKGSFWGHNDNRADFSDPRRLLPELDDEMASRLCCGSWGS